MSQSQTSTKSSLSWSKLLRKHRVDSPAAPPSFPPADPNDPGDLPRAPDPAVFTTGGPLSAVGEEAQEPSVAQVAVHLLLLEVFWRYKSRFLQPDGEVRSFFSSALGLEEEGVDGEVLWKIVVEIAVGRFEAWWKVVGRDVEAMERDEAEMEDEGPQKRVMELPAEMLPPLDVLLVWQGFMLNSQCYYDDCVAFGMPGMLAVVFPWEAVKNAIDFETLEYTLPDEAVAFFKVATSQHHDLFSQLKAEPFSKPRLPTMEIACPQCEAEHNLPIVAWHSSTLDLLCTACGFMITHDALCAEQLRQDIKKLVSGGPGIRGTFSPPFTQGAAINAVMKQHFSSAPPTLSSHPTVDSLLEPLPNPHQVLPFYLPTSPWSSASISLTAAVLRQGGFVDKMHHWLWIRSPSPWTLPRAKEKYLNFFRLFARYPGEIMVPTLDLDVFWHTHLLSPSRYYYFCLSPDAAGRFIDHTDKLSPAVLGNRFERTSERYWSEFEMEYGGCFCWACEMERDDEEQGVGGWWGRGKREKRREWERHVKVAFWREVERRRGEGGEQVGLRGLEGVLRGGMKK